MTADVSQQEKPTTTGTMLPILALVFAVLTLLFALFSMVIGNRMTALSADHLRAQKERAASETTAIEATQSALQEARQQMEAQKKESEKLRNQLSAAMQQVKKLKGDLANANQAIETLKSESSTLPTMKPAAPQPAMSGQQPAGDEASIEQKPAANPPGEIESQPQPAPAAAPAKQGSQLEESYISPESSTAASQTSAARQPAGVEKSEESQTPPAQIAIKEDAAE